MDRIALAALLLVLGAPARAQTRVGLADAAALGSAPSASAGASVSAAPSAVPALLAAPALSAAPLAAAPALSAPAALAAPLAAPAPLPAPAALASPAAVPIPAPVAQPATAGKEDEAKPTAMSELVELDRRLAGEGHAADFSADYLRPGRPFAFGASEKFRYQVALKAFKSGRAEGPEAVKTLLDSARELAASAGIEVEDVIRPSPAGAEHKGLRVLPKRDGSALNKLAFDLDRRYGASVEYVPERLIGAVAAYNSGAKVLFLPEFGRRDAFEAILHETAHAQFTERLARGDVSPFHGQLVAWDGRAIAPGASSYVSHMSLEEIYTHGKELKHQLAAMRRAGPITLETALPTLTFIYQYADVLRSARLNLALAKSYVGNGTAKVVLAEGEPEPFPGGAWYRVNLPYGRFFFPARVEAPPKRGLLKRLFTAEPETAAERALRRRAEVLLAAIAEIDASVAAIHDGLRSDAPDAVALNKEADKIVASLRRAEDSFRK